MTGGVSSLAIDIGSSFPRQHFQSDPRMTLNYKWCLVPVLARLWNVLTEIRHPDFDFLGGFSCDDRGIDDSGLPECCSP